MFNKIKNFRKKDKIINDLSNIDFNKIQEDILYEFFENGLIFKFSYYNHFKKEQFNNDLSNFIDFINKEDIVNDEKDIIKTIFTRGECFLFSRILQKYLDKKGINSGIFLLMQNTGDKNHGGFEVVDIDHAVVFNGKDFIDINGVITDDIINNKLYYDNDLYINSLYSKDSLQHHISVNIDNLVKYNQDINDIDSLEWLYETDLIDFEEEVKTILYNIFKKYIYY